MTKSLNRVYFRVSRAPVAQLDRALASGAKGCGFDPRRAHFLQKFSRSQRFPLAQRFDSVEQILFARDASDLVAQLAVLEKE